MPRSIQQTPVRAAFLSLQVEIDRVRATFLEVEQYYHRSAVVDFDAHPQMGLEALTGLLQRMDALARTLRSGALREVERVWKATEDEIQSVTEHQTRLAAARDRDERDRLDADREEAADARHAEAMDEQRQVNRLLRDPEPPKREERPDIESAGHE